MTTQKTWILAGGSQMFLMALRYLSGRKLRTVLTTLAIVFGVALIFAANLVLPGAMNAFQRTASAVSGQADISVSSVSGESFAPDAVLAAVSGVDNVKTVSGILRREFSLPTLGTDETGAAPQIELIGIEPTLLQEVRPFVMSEGRFLTDDDSGQAVLPAGIAEIAPELKVGTTFPLVTSGGLKVYTVVGLLAEQGNLSTVQILVNLPDAQAAFNQPGLINGLEIALQPGSDRDLVVADLEQALGSGFNVGGGSDQSSLFGSIQIGFLIFDLLGAMALFLGAFLIFNTFRTIVVERRRDLSTLRAVGATRRQITQMILIESLIQGLIGTLIGLVIGYLMASGMINAVGRVMATYMSGLQLELTLNVTAVILAVGLGLATALLAGYLPARSAGRMSPLEALRPAATSAVQKAARWSLIVGGGLIVVAFVLLVSGSRGAVGGALLFMIGLVIAAPGLVVPMAKLFSGFLTMWFAREGDLARGNLVRQPGRAAITGSTLMIGLAVLVLMAALISSLVGLLTNLANRNFASDVLLVPQAISIYNNVVGADENLANRLRDLPEVETVTSLRYASTVSDTTALEVLGIDPEDYLQVASLEFNEGAPEAAYAALASGRNVILTSVAKTALKVEVGSDLVIQTANGPQTYRVVGVGNDILSFKLNTLFISQDNLATDFHKTEDIMLMINLRPDADSASVMAQIEDITQDYPQFTARLTGQYRDELLNTTAAMTVLLYGMAALILFPAALGLLNTLTINVLERTREIGIVRAMGGSQKQVRRVVTAEALLLGIFGAALGVVAGVAMSYGIVSASSAVGWKLAYEFPLIGVIAAVVVGVLLALFASILPARNAARLDIIRALQYE